MAAFSPSAIFGLLLLLLLLPLQLAAAASASSPPSCNKHPSIPNGGFESGSLSPWTANVEAPSSIKVVAGGYNNSKYAAQITVTNGSEYADVAQYSIASCQDTKYLVAFAFKRLDATASCSIFAYAREGEVSGNYFQHNLTASLQPGGWVTAAVEYDSHDGEDFEVQIGVQCDENDPSARASILLDDVHLVNNGTLAAPGCPKAVALQNGGFDAGTTAPWQYRDDVFPPNPPNLSLVSPGYQGRYALQLVFPNGTDWQIAQNVSNLCEGSYYTVAFALNWHYPATAPTHLCSVSVGIGGIESVFGCEATTGSGIVDSSSIPGWVPHSYVCNSQLNGLASFVVAVNCGEASVPAFTLLMDSFSVALNTTAGS